MKTMAYWVGLILVGLSGGRPDAALVNIVVIMYVVSFLFVMFFYVSNKLRRYYLIFLVLYLAFIAKMLGFIWNRFLWSLAPSLTFGWWAISGILIVLGFVAGCKIIAYFMREEKAEEEMR